MAEAAGAGIATTTIIRELCWDAVPPLAAYVTLRLIGVSHWLALLAATLVAAWRVIWLVVRPRALNPYALLMVEVFGLDLALSYLPGDARLPLVTGSVIAAALGITWLVMVALGHPPTLEAAKMWDPERAAWRAEQFRAIPEVRHGYRVTSTVWGAAFLTEAIALALLIYVVPRAAMSAVTNAVSIAYLAALIGWVGWYQRQWIHGAQEHRPGSGDAGGEQLRAGRPGQQAATAEPGQKTATARGSARRDCPGPAREAGLTARRLYGTLMGRPRPGLLLPVLAADEWHNGRPPLKTSEELRDNCRCRATSPTMAGCHLRERRHGGAPVSRLSGNCRHAGG